MSLNQLILDEFKPWLDARVCNLTVDCDATIQGTFTANGAVNLPPQSINVNDLETSGSIGFIHDNGATVAVKDIEIMDLQQIGSGAPDGTVLTHNAGVITFEPPFDDTEFANSEQAPNPLIGFENHRIVSIASTGTDIQTTLASNNAGAYNSAALDVDGNVSRSGSIFSSNTTINAGASALERCGAIGSNVVSFLNDARTCGSIGALNSSIDSSSRCTLNASQASSMLDCTRCSIQDSLSCDMDTSNNSIILASNNLTVSGANRGVFGGNGSIAWSLNSDTGDIVSVGNIGGSTLSGTLQESDIAPGANGEVLTTVGGVSSWAVPSSSSSIYSGDGALAGIRS